VSTLTTGDIAGAGAGAGSLLLDSHGLALLPPLSPLGYGVEVPVTGRATSVVGLYKLNAVDP
jgi:hypothetical protein